MIHNDIVSRIKDFTFFFYKGKRYFMALLNESEIKEVFNEDVIKKTNMSSYKYFYAIHSAPCYIDDVDCDDDDKYILSSYYYFTNTKDGNLSALTSMSCETDEIVQCFDIGDDLLLISKAHISKEQFEVYFVNCETYYNHIRSHGSEYVQYHSGMDWKCLINKCEMDAENNTADVQLKYIYQDEEKLIDIHINKNNKKIEINGIEETLAALEEKYLLEFVMYYLSFSQM